MRVVPLSNLAVERLQSVFEEEIEYWRRELHWDFAPSAQLIRKYLTSQSLPGYALESPQGEVVGYTYFLASRPVGFVGDVFIRSHFAKREGYQSLLTEACRSLKAWDGLNRIECQLFPFNIDLEPLFRQLGFQANERHFMVLEASDIAGPRKPPPSFDYRPWNAGYFATAAETIYDSYRGSPDHELCFDYQSREGCARFLRNLVDNPGCGTFQPDASFLAFDSKGRVSGLIITSRISEDTGMIPQISVRRDRQGQGIGSTLLGIYFEAARHAGLKRVALSVSDANQGALSLYQRIGFRRERSFYAFIWERRLGPSSKPRR